MRIKISNVYNTMSLGKSEQELKNLASKHLKGIINKLKSIDKNVKVTLTSINRVDWTKENRGVDYRLYLNINKTGRKLTAKNVYCIANTTCLRPCYF